MKLSKFLLFGLASTATASTWFGKAGKSNIQSCPQSRLIPAVAYNKWHETELERWLSDHDVPYPTAADRKELESLVKNNWQSKVVNPLAAAGDKTSDSFGNTKDWIFDR